MISPKQLALKQIGYCLQRQQRFLLCKILLPRMLILMILHEAASRLFTALQLFNVWIESWENWTPAQCFALDRVDSFSLHLAPFACLPAPNPRVLHSHLLRLLFILHALKQCHYIYWPSEQVKIVINKPTYRCEEFISQVSILSQHISS